MNRKTQCILIQIMEKKDIKQKYIFDSIINSGYNSNSFIGYLETIKGNLSSQRIREW